MCICNYCAYKPYCEFMKQKGLDTPSKNNKDKCDNFLDKKWWKCSGNKT